MIEWIIIIILSLWVPFLIIFPPKALKEIEMRYKETSQEMATWKQDYEKILAEVAIWKNSYEEKQKEAEEVDRRYKEDYDKKVIDLEKEKKRYKEEIDIKMEIEIGRFKKDFWERYEKTLEPAKKETEESWSNRDRY